jgi:pimeloyl-ACP methyl ester carboxylesterase
MEDVRVVMDAVGWERATILGFSDGRPLAFLFAATYPERTERLILLKRAHLEVALVLLELGNEDERVVGVGVRELARSGLERGFNGRGVFNGISRASRCEIAVDGVCDHPPPSDPYAQRLCDGSSPGRRWP